MDPHYVLLQLPPGCTPVTCPEAVGDQFGPSAYVLGPNGTDPVNGTTWALNDANSQWLGPRALPFVDVLASDADPYVFRMVFNVSALGLDPTTTNIQLAWASDTATNSAIRLCSVTSISDAACAAGTTITGSANGGPLGMTSVSLVHGLNGAFFSSGLNALDFIVYNGGSTPSPLGFRVDILSATASDVAVAPPPPQPVPEPTSLVLLGTGALGVLVARRRTARR